MLRDYEGGDLALAYDKLRPEYPDEIRRVVSACIEKNKNVGVGKIFLLDVGCGGGKSTTLFSSDFENILGIDISAAQIKIARGRLRGRKNVQFQLVDGARFPAETGSVDVVFCAAALHYLDLSKFLAECDRVLVNGGLIAATTYTPHSLRSLNGDLIADMFSDDSLYRKAIIDFFRSSGMNEAACDRCLDRYDFIFDAIKCPTKRREKNITVDIEYTVEEFVQFYATCAGYYKLQKGELDDDPLERFRETMSAVFRQAGLQFKSDTRFVLVYEFTLIIVEKKNGFTMSSWVTEHSSSRSR